MRWSDIPFHPPVTTLRWFAAVGVLLSTGLAAWAFHQPARSTLTLTLLFLIPRVSWPQVQS